MQMSPEEEDDEFWGSLKRISSESNRHCQIAQVSESTRLDINNYEDPQVYDHDLFSADDIMGEAEIDLPPMITAAMAFGDPSRLGDMQIGWWFMTTDNTLLKDSTINVVVWLRR
ncbi:hypothetical protein GUJ93_ZPchr0004g39359 [Zizania palustris]|uniref:Uncharacterized protein n=1 Tax=Zizania palustris TaxID=103762 RepID=A0A8J5T022_ZIZPA|nr:hypothetical protein GUJ93_ZPchr0004g39359 [Zizania palustris]